MSVYVLGFLMGWIRSTILLTLISDSILDLEVKEAKEDVENFEWRPKSLLHISNKPLKDNKMQNFRQLGKSKFNDQWSLEPMQDSVKNNNYQIESSIAKVSASKSKATDDKSTIHSDSYYGDDLTLVFVTPVPKIKQKQSSLSPTTIIKSTTTTEYSVESSLDFSTTELPQTLQAIFQAEPNDYDFIPSLSFNEIPAVATPPPSTFLKTNLIKDKTLEEFFEIALFNDVGGKQDVSQSSRKPEVILPSDYIFTPPFTTAGSKDFLGKP